MSMEFDDQIEEYDAGLLKKIIIWSVVLLISLMLLLTILFQPRFFTFVNQLFHKKESLKHLLYFIILSNVCSIIENLLLGNFYIMVLLLCYMITCYILTIFIQLLQILKGGDLFICCRTSNLVVSKESIYQFGIFFNTIKQRKNLIRKNRFSFIFSRRLFMRKMEVNK